MPNVELTIQDLKHETTVDLGDVDYKIRDDKSPVSFPINLFEDSMLTIKHLRVFYVIRELNKGTRKQCDAKNNTIAIKAQVSEFTVIHAIQRLEILNYIEVKKRPYKSNAVTLTPMAISTQKTKMSDLPTIPFAMLFSPNLSKTDLRTWVKISKICHGNKNKICYFTETELADELHLHRVTVVNAIRTLKAAGYLRIKSTPTGKIEITIPKKWNIMKHHVTLKKRLVELGDLT
jgi:Mn-dependent DtxR family transcriptional regulator